MRKLQLLFLIFGFVTANAQSGGPTTVDSFLPNITPPSPTSYNLGNYGNIPIGLFTGSANIPIPLLEYGTQNVRIPISLTYTSNGIKVDDTGNVPKLVMVMIRDINLLKIN